MRRPGDHLICQLLPESLRVNHCVNRCMNHLFLYHTEPQAWAMVDMLIIPQFLWLRSSGMAHMGHPL